jgi:hypothetical protein
VVCIEIDNDDPSAPRAQAVLGLIEHNSYVDMVEREDAKHTVERFVVENDVSKLLGVTASKVQSEAMAEPRSGSGQGGGIDVDANHRRERLEQTSRHGSITASDVQKRRTRSPCSDLTKNDRQEI